MQVAIHLGGRIIQFSDEICQALLAGISLNSPEYKISDGSPQMDLLTIFRHVHRIARGQRANIDLPICAYILSAVVEVGIVKRSAAMVKNGLEL